MFDSETNRRNETYIIETHLFPDHYQFTVCNTLDGDPVYYKLVLTSPDRQAYAQTVFKLKGTCPVILANF